MEKEEDHKSASAINNVPRREEQNKAYPSSDNQQILQWNSPLQRNVEQQSWPQFPHAQFNPAGHHAHAQLLNKQVQSAGNSALQSNVEQQSVPNSNPCVVSESPTSFPVNPWQQFTHVQFNPAGHHGQLLNKQAQLAGNSALQSNVEQPSAPNSKPCVASQSPTSFPVNPWPQFPHVQFNPAGYHGQLLNQQAQSAGGFWMPMPQNPGFSMPGANASAMCQQFGPFGSVNPSWPDSGSMTKYHPQGPDPNSCFQVGFRYPGFPGPWDPSSWQGQIQQSQPPACYNFPGASGNMAIQPPTAPSADPPGQPSEMSVFRPLVEISKNFQQLWDALTQLPRNDQPRFEIDQLQSDLADHKLRIEKLEREIVSLKQPTKVSTDHVTETAVSGQGLKRGRPKKTVPSADPLLSHDAFETIIGGKKPKSGIFEKVILTRVESEVKPSGQIAISLQEDKKVSNLMTHNSDDQGTNRSNTMMLSRHVEIRTMTSNSVGLGSLVNSKGYGKDASNASLPGFGNVGSVTQQGGKIVSGGRSANEENASDELDNAVATSTKGETEEETEDDGSSESKEK